MEFECGVRMPIILFAPLYLMCIPIGIIGGLFSLAVGLGLLVSDTSKIESEKERKDIKRVGVVLVVVSILFPAVCIGVTMTMNKLTEEDPAAHFQYSLSISADDNVSYEIIVPVAFSHYTILGCFYGINSTNGETYAVVDSDILEHVNDENGLRIRGSGDIDLFLESFEIIDDVDFSLYRSYGVDNHYVYSNTTLNLSLTSQNEYWNYADHDDPWAFSSIEFSGMVKPGWNLMPSEKEHWESEY